MPNYDKVYAQNKLKQKLQEAKHARRQQGIEEENTSSSTSTSSTNHQHKKKVVKKPLPNFGGGKLGHK